MALVKSVLVGTDFSEGSDSALLSAVRIAEEYQAILHAVHVVESLPADGVLNPALAHREEIARALRARLNQAVEKAGLKIDDDLLSTELRVGRPAKEMLDAADEVQADVIVVGHRGKGLLERTLLGSVAATLVRNSPRPVLVAREPEKDRVQSVLVAVDLDDASVELIRVAKDWADRNAMPLHVLYAWEIAGLADYHSAMPNIPARNYDIEITQDARKRLESMVQDAIGADADVELTVRPGTAAYEIVFAAEREKHALVVVGCRGRRGLSKLLLGNTAERVVEHAPCNVLVIHI